MYWLWDNATTILAIGAPVVSFVAVQFKMYYTLVAHSDALEKLSPRVDKLEDRLWNTELEHTRI